MFPTQSCYHLVVCVYHAKHAEKQVGLMATSQHRLESFSSSGRAMRFSGTDWDQKQ